MVIPRDLTNLMVTQAVKGLYLTLGYAGEMSKGWMDVVEGGGVGEKQVHIQLIKEM